MINVIGQANSLTINNLASNEITATLVPQTTAGLYGFVDALDERGIRGWLIDAANPGNALTVEVSANGTVIASARTEEDRPDVGMVIGAASYAGFSVRWYRKILEPLVAAGTADQVVSIKVTEKESRRSIGSEMLVPVATLQMWLNDLPAEDWADTHEGLVQVVSPYRIAGYAQDLVSSDTAVKLEVRIDQAPVAIIVADRARADAPGLENGFDWTVPRSLRDGKVHRVDIVLQGTDFALPGSGRPIQFRQLPQEARQEQVDRALALAVGPMWISGWVAQSGHDQPLGLQIFMDGRSIGSCLAGQYGEDLDGNPAYPFENVHTRYIFPTPPQALDGWLHKFEVRVAEWGSDQPPNGTTEWAHGDRYGAADVDDGRRVNGWVAFRSTPTAEDLALPVDVLVDGHVVAQCFLDSQHPEIAKRTGLKHTYKFYVDLGVDISGAAQLQFDGIQLRTTLRGSTADKRLKGSLDTIDRSTIGGWAVNLGEPNVKPDVEILCDGEVVAVIRPSEPRPDVAKALKLSSVNVGFVFPTPPAFLDGERHAISARFTTGESLGTELSMVQFQRNFDRLPTTDAHPVLSEFIVQGSRTSRQASREMPLVSIVILNRNGATILDTLFSSFVAVNTFERHEFIVVDHGSKDESLAVIESWSKRGVPVTAVPLTYNGSFSSSNNLAIRKYARGKYVLLLNNDIIFVQDVLGELVKTLESDSRIGLVGVKLLDVVEDRGRNFYPPIQHLGIRYRYNDKLGVLPYDEKLSPDSATDAFHPIRPAGVTGAVTLARRDEYLAIGGLEEEYFYGYEDVDLCLKFRVLNKQEIVCRNDLQVLHHRGYSRLSGREMQVFERLTRNHDVLIRRWGYAIRRIYRSSLYTGDRVYASSQLRIAFAVTETGDGAVAGDYFTALELAKALAEFHHVEPVFLSERNDWYDLEGINVLVVMRHDYDLRSMRNTYPDLTTVAWMRNHFENWERQHWFGDFDLYYSSSRRHAARLTEMGFQCEELPIATNAKAMVSGTADATLQAVVGFNGSAWSVRRSVADALLLCSSEFPTAMVGAGWDGDDFKALHRGLLPYDRMPDFYASVDIVVDDANESARAWGSANSRLFDALAAGKLVITNSRAASEDLFQGQLPVWTTPEDVIELVRKYSGEDSARQQLVRELQAEVCAKHTYERRAKSFIESLQRWSQSSLRIAIKTPVPSLAERGWWGDWHYAQGLRRALKKRGHAVRVDLLPDWNQPTPGDDVVIVLRGLSKYRPEPSKLNILWIISHPDDVSVEECREYDKVFTASEKHAAHLRSLGIDAQVLMQCADANVMHPVERDPDYHHQHLFIGNSRRQVRPIVADLIEVGTDLAIYGREWDGLVSDDFVRGALVKNEDLCRYYSSAGTVYNDHWPDMQKWGFLSNRLFDLAACGAHVISDAVDGIEETFGGLIRSYRSRDELARMSSAKSTSSWTSDQAEALRRIVTSGHTFDHRAEVLLSAVATLDQSRMLGKLES